MIEKLKAEVAALKAQLIQHGITPMISIPKNLGADEEDLLSEES